MSRKHVRMIERRVGTDAHEFLHADFDGSMAGVVLKVRNDVIGHNMLRFWSMGGMGMVLRRVPDRIMLDIGMRVPRKSCFRKRFHQF